MTVPLGDRCAAKIAAAEMGAIEFLGHKGVDIERFRKALPVHEGDPYSEATKDVIRQAVGRAIGKQPTDALGGAA